MQTILISGGTGLVGKALSKLLIEKGYRVIILTRDPSAQKATNENLSYARWDVTEKEIDINAIQQADFIIHLAGAGVMDKKWTEVYKKEIIDSRVESAKLIIESLRQHSNKVKAVISASAIGWYSPAEHAHTEDEPADNSFLGETCRLWEESTELLKHMGKRLVKLRIGIVLSAAGGAMAEFIKPLKFRVAAILGNGKQVISWIHIDDLCRMFVYAIENENMQGVYNAVGPNPVTNKEMTIALAKKIRGKSYLPVHVPSFILKIMLGGRSIEILKSATISCKKILAAGFAFKYEKLGDVVKELN